MNIRLYKRVTIEIPCTVEISYDPGERGRGQIPDTPASWEFIKAETFEELTEEAIDKHCGYAWKEQIDRELGIRKGWTR